MPPWVDRGWYLLSQHKDQLLTRFASVDAWAKRTLEYSSRRSTGFSCHSWSLWRHTQALQCKTERLAGQPVCSSQTLPNPQGASEVACSVEHQPPGLCSGWHPALLLLGHQRLQLLLLRTIRAAVTL